MRLIPVILIWTMMCGILLAYIPSGTDAEVVWESKHLYSDQWLFFEIGTLDQGTDIDYGIKVTTPDESVNIAFMDSTNYAAFSSSSGETFVGWDVQYQVRSREATTTIPYQQQWYFVAISDTGFEIDIEYYTTVVEKDDNGGICGSAFMISGLVILGAIFTLALSKKRA